VIEKAPKGLFFKIAGKEKEIRRYSVSWALHTAQDIAKRFLEVRKQAGNRFFFLFLFC